MTLTPEQQVKIRKKEECTPEALKRDPLSSYREGYFHVTLNTRGEAPVLSSIVGNVDGEGPCAPHCEYTELGNRVKKVIASIPDFHKWTIVLESEVMPDHIHMLLHLQPGGKEHLGKVIGGFMGGCSHAYWDVLGIDWRKDHPTQERNSKAGGERSAAAQRVPDRDRDHTRSFRGPSLFVRGYNDVEAVGDEEVEIKRQYIRNNPRKHLIRRNNLDCFLIRRNMKSANWTPERIMKGLCADRFIAANRSKQTEAWRQLVTHDATGSRGQSGATLKFQDSHPILDLVGNMELLKRPLFPLVCHRADSHLFEQQKAAVLKAAREQEGVIVTACVSPKEREIVKILQQELLPVIEVMDNGFSDRYKPAGKAFYAVAEARRLEVTPWEYEYRHHKDDKAPDITREMCMVMNQLVRTIAKKPDDWWKPTP